MVSPAPDEPIHAVSDVVSLETDSEQSSESASASGDSDGGIFDGLDAQPIAVETSENLLEDDEGQEAASDDSADQSDSAVASLSIRPQGGMMTSQVSYLADAFPAQSVEELNSANGPPGDSSDFQWSLDSGSEGWVFNLSAQSGLLSLAGETASLDGVLFDLSGVSGLSIDMGEGAVRLEGAFSFSSDVSIEAGSVTLSGTLSARNIDLHADSISIGGTDAATPHLSAAHHISMEIGAGVGSPEEPVRARAESLDLESSTGGIFVQTSDGVELRNAGTHGGDIEILNLDGLSWWAARWMPGEETS